MSTAEHLSIWGVGDNSENPITVSKARTDLRALAVFYEIAGHPCVNGGGDACEFQLFWPHRFQEILAT